MPRIEVNPKYFNPSQWEEMAASTMLEMEDCYSKAEPFIVEQFSVFGAADDCEEKAKRVRAGELGESETEDDGDGVDVDEWADQLEEIAATLRSLATNQPFQNFADMVARMHQDGEPFTEDGEMYEQSDEDAQMTLSNLIETARKLTGYAPKEDN